MYMDPVETISYGCSVYSLIFVQFIVDHGYRPVFLIFFLINGILFNVKNELLYCFDNILSTFCKRRLFAKKMIIISNDFKFIRFVINPKIFTIIESNRETRFINLYLTDNFISS